MNNHYI